jgi:hypothetical protein
VNFEQVPLPFGAMISTWQPEGSVCVVEFVQPSAGLPSAGYAQVQPAVPAVGGQL